jgi:hypothetical protein
MQRRLYRAMQYGDSLILQMLPAAALNTGKLVLTQIAEREAIADLRRYRDGELSEQDAFEAQQRREDLAKMRDREQQPGNPENQRSVTPRAVRSRGKYSTRRLHGYT